jgi:toluene monooxygenase system protein A
MPSPSDRKWLRKKYPKYWNDMEAVWERIGARWKVVGPGSDKESSVLGTVLPTFCDLCQLPLSAGTPRNNTANTLVHEGKDYIFCSQPCRWIFLREPQRYASHEGLVKRVLSGEAPADFKDLITDYFSLNPDTWGKDVYAGDYDWL